MEYIVIEIGKAVAKLFLNPLIYWFIFISFMMSKRRVADEQLQFQQTLFPMGAEFNRTGKLTIFGSFFISLIALIFNITFVHEIILFLSIIIFILSFAFGFKLLSAAYTLGFTFILFKILESYHNRLFETGFITNHTFSSIALLIALFLLLEASLYRTVTNETAFPELVKSSRGRWFGMYHIQKASFLPFFVLIPGKITIASLPILPYFTLASEEISFAFVPFFIGFHHIVKGQLPEVVTASLRKQQLFLGLLVLIGALLSFYLPGIAFLTILLAIIGKLLMNYKVEQADRTEDYLFMELNNELKIFSVVPNSPADKLGFKIGDRITKVNDLEVHSFNEFQEALDSLIRFPSFEVMTTDHEVRSITNTRFKGDAYELGIIFPVEPKE